MKLSTLINIALSSALTFATLACGNENTAGTRSTVPPNLLPEDVFVKVLTDFALAESAVNLNVKNVAVNRMDTVYAFDPLKENHVKKSKYDSTVQFYIKNPDLYKKVYENVLAALSEIQTRGDSLRKDSTSK